MSYYQGFPEDRGSVGGGFGLGVVLNVLQGIIFWIVMGVAHGQLDALVIGLGGWGLIQLVYIIPIYIYLRRSKSPDTAKGLIIAASLVLLMNVGCWGCLTFNR
jgi:heme/copper-type cytochrome/quinol oxidase subunit 4